MASSLRSSRAPAISVTGRVHPRRRIAFAAALRSPKLAERAAEARLRPWDYARCENTAPSGVLPIEVRVSTTSGRSSATPEVTIWNFIAVAKDRLSPTGSSKTLLRRWFRWIATKTPMGEFPAWLRMELRGSATAQLEYCQRRSLQISLAPTAGSSRNRRRGRRHPCRHTANPREESA